jgi:protein-tyrosine phosphatase
VAWPSGIEPVRLGAGAVALTHRPKLRLLPGLATAGATHLVTLLSKREGALQIGSAAEAAGLEWIWVDVPNGQEPTPASRNRMVAALATIAPLVAGGATAVIHCSAGIHRTGMFGYALLRAHGLDPGKAAATLQQLRAVTADGVGEQRLEWAEELATLAGHGSGFGSETGHG